MSESATTMRRPVAPLARLMRPLALAAALLCYTATCALRPAVPVPALVISEVMADPSRVADASGEWFEIHNRGAAPVDLEGYRITSGPTGSETHVIAARVVVEPGGYVVLGNNASSATNGSAPVAYSYGTSVTLNNSNTDWLTLKTPGGTLVDSVAYSASTVSGRTRTITSPAYAPSAGIARAVVDPSRDNTVMAGTNWANAVAPYGRGDRGTPGGPHAATSVAGAPPARAPPAAGAPSAGAAGDVASISISVNEPARVPVGFSKPAFPTVRTGAGAIVTSATPLVWTSSDAAVATVSERGYITGVSPGAVTIRATAPNGVSGAIAFAVEAAAAPTTAVYRNHVEFGTPRDRTPADDIVLTKPQFVLSYNARRGGPNWVSWHIDATHFGDAPRCDCFSADQSLPPGVYRVVDFDYRGGGYDRGHMVQSESRTATEQDNAATFLLTNILPQAAENNQGPWSQLENHLNDLARQQGKEVYVVAGGIYGAEPATLKGEGKVAIPEYTWKVAVIVGAGRGLADVRSASDLQVIAVRMPNLTAAGVPASAAGIRNVPWQSYAVTVDEIETATGYDLLAALPDEIERQVEAARATFRRLEGGSK